MNKLSEAKYRRVLLKLSGEALAGEQKTGVNVEVVGKICDKIKEITEMRVWRNLALVRQLRLREEKDVSL